MGAVVLLAGVGGSPGRDVTRQPVTQPVSVTAALDAAVASVDTARKELLDAVGLVVVAATALDAGDEACGTGQAGPAATARGPVGAAITRAQAVPALVPALVAAYRAALGRLQRSAVPLDSAQRQALEAVVRAGGAEAAAGAGFAQVAAAALPAYAASDAAQRRWLERAGAGWYRDAAEAAAAYAVLARPQQASLDQARTTLRAADGTRRTATDRQRSAVSAADEALAPLREPAPPADVDPDAPP